MRYSYRVEYGNFGFNERHWNCGGKYEALRVYESQKYAFRYVRILDNTGKTVASWINYAEGAEEVYELA